LSTPSGTPASFDGQQGGGRIALGGLEHEGVAAGDGRGIHPHGHHGREVEGRYAGADAKRLAQGVGIYRRAHFARILALEQFGNAADIFHVLDAARRFAHGVIEHLAMLAGNGFGDFFLVVLQQNAEPLHEAGALQRAQSGPGGQRRLRRLHGFSHFGGGRQTHFGSLPARGGVEHRGRAAGAGGNGLAVDEVVESLDHEHRSPCKCRPAAMSGPDVIITPAGGRLRRHDLMEGVCWKS